MPHKATPDAVVIKVIMAGIRSDSCTKAVLRLLLIVPKSAKPAMLTTKAWGKLLNNPVRLSAKIPVATINKPAQTAERYLCCGSVSTSLPIQMAAIIADKLNAKPPKGAMRSPVIPVHVISGAAGAS